MPALNMGRTSYNLNKKTIEENVKSNLGNYALGYVNSKNAFVVKYVGRSDYSLQSRLLDHIGEYKKFKFTHTAPTKIAAYKMECKNYHDFGGSDSLDNEIHPARPKGTTKKLLPCCGKKDCKE